MLASKSLSSTAPIRHTARLLAQSNQQRRSPHHRSTFAPKSMNFFTSLFGGDKKKREVRIIGNTPNLRGKNDEILTWARTAKPGTMTAPSSAPHGQELATFAGGCFWGIELAYQRVSGVTKTWVGYTQGQKPSPTYEEVCSGRTGHTEAIHLHYDPTEVTYTQLLDVFFERTDPTTKNRQGNDAGTQYRSGIYYHTDQQKADAEAAIAKIQGQLDAGTYPRRVAGGKKVVVELEPATEFWLAEEYHQQYLSKGGRFGTGQCADKGCNDPIRCYG